MSTSRRNHQALLLNDGTVLVAGGHECAMEFDTPCGTLDSAEIYDPRLEAWKPVGRMSLPRAPGAIYLLPDGSALVVGGVFLGLSGAEVAERYDPVTAEWRRTGATTPGFPGTRAQLRDGSVVVALRNGIGTMAGNAHRYDPASNTWIETGPMHDILIPQSLLPLPDGRLLVVGRPRTADAVLNTAEVYDPGTNHWTPTRPMNAITSVLAALVLQDGSVLVLGGPPFSRLADEVYDPATDQWSLVERNHTLQRVSSVSLLPDGTVLAIGYRSDLGRLEAELFDPRTRVWRSAAGPEGIRTVEQQVRLPSGKLLLVGRGTNNALASALYDPESGTWSGQGELDESRSGFSMTVLADGSVLVAGGRAGPRMVTATAELLPAVAVTRTPVTPAPR